MAYREQYPPTHRNNPRRANGTLRTKNRERMKAEGRPCWICKAFGRPAAIDYSLTTYRDPRDGKTKRHPMSFELDEIIPVSKYWLGGYPTPEACANDYSNLDATHRCCNNWRKNKTREEVLAIALQARSGKKIRTAIKPVEQPMEF